MNICASDSKNESKQLLKRKYEVNMKESHDRPIGYVPTYPLGQYIKKQKIS